MPQIGKTNQSIPPRRTQPPGQAIRILKKLLNIFLITTALLGGSMVVALISRACDNNQETSVLEGCGSGEERGRRQRPIE